MKILRGAGELTLLFLSLAGFARVIDGGDWIGGMALMSASLILLVWSWTRKEG